MLFDVCAPFPTFASYFVSSFSSLICLHTKDLLLFNELLSLHVRTCLGFMFLINLVHLIKQFSRLFFSTVYIMCKLRNFRTLALNLFGYIFLFYKLILVMTLMHAVFLSRLFVLSWPLPVFYVIFGLPWVLSWFSYPNHVDTLTPEQFLWGRGQVPQRCQRNILWILVPLPGTGHMSGLVLWLPIPLHWKKNGTQQA